MRAIILSDSHGRFDRLASVVEKHPEAEVFLFLGDGMREWDDLRCLYPEKVFFQVRGNCDLYSDEPATRLIELGGMQVFLCHGHTLSVKSGLTVLEQKATSMGVAVALFGHTHQQVSSYHDGLYLVNPGSLGMNSSPEYAMLDFQNGQVVPVLVKEKN